MTTKHDEALMKQLAWRTDVRLFAVEVVKRGLELHGQGKMYFGSDDVATSPERAGTAGSAMHWLVKAGIIRHWRQNSEDETVWGGFRASRRPKSNGALVAVYELAGVELACEWLARNNVPTEPRQAELAL